MEVGPGGQRPPWADAFELYTTDDATVPVAGAALPLSQVGANHFRMDGRLVYTGPPDDLDDELRSLTFAADQTSDLASIPISFGWFERSHGSHTPAALFHDRYTDPGSPIDRVEADLLFRHMLQAVGVPWLKRNIMWAAVTVATRWAAGWLDRLLFILWMLLSTAGLLWWIAALFGVDTVFGLTVLPSGAGRWWVLVATTIAPIFASVLWRRQWPAGIVAGYTAPWASPVAAVAGLGRLCYQALEWIIATIAGSSTD